MPIPIDFYILAQQCAPLVHPKTMVAVVGVESSYNPYAIGVVGGRLERQPSTKGEAVATVKALALSGYNFSLGVGQVNRFNLSKFGLDYDSAFEPCENIQAGSKILAECFKRAKTQFPNDQQALQASFSCYYSGNFSTGFKPDFQGQPSYVQKVLNTAATPLSAIVASQVPAIQPIPVIRTSPAIAASLPKISDTAYRVTNASGQQPANAPQAKQVKTKIDTTSVYANTSEQESVLVYSSQPQPQTKAEGKAVESEETAIVFR